MSQETVVVLGSLTSPPGIGALLSEFNWTLENAATTECLASVCSRANVIAVLVDPAAMHLPWKQAVAKVHKVAPMALCILCYHFSDQIDWVEASAAGAFHLLGLPLNLSELRQSFGFIWAEQNKLSGVIPLKTVEQARPRRTAKARARGHVA